MKGKYSNLPLLESNRRGQDRTDGMRKVGKWEIIKKPKSEDDTVKLAEQFIVSASENVERLAYVQEKDAVRYCDCKGDGFQIAGPSTALLS